MCYPLHSDVASFVCGVVRVGFVVVWVGAVVVRNRNVVDSIGFLSVALEKNETVLIAIVSKY